MRSLHELLNEALALAYEAKPTLTLRELGDACGLAQSNISRARRGCSESTLASVLDGIEGATGVRLEIGLLRVSENEGEARDAAQR